MHNANAAPISRAEGFFRAFARLSTTVGSKDTRDLSWWSLALSRTLGIEISPNQVRQAVGADARIRVDLAGQTNIKGRQTLVAAGRLSRKEGSSEGGAL